MLRVHSVIKSPFNWLVDLFSSNWFIWKCRFIAFRDGSNSHRIPRKWWLKYHCNVSSVKRMVVAHGSIITVLTFVYKLFKFAQSRTTSVSIKSANSDSESQRGNNNISLILSRLRCIYSLLKYMKWHEIRRTYLRFVAVSQYNWKIFIYSSSGYFLLIHWIFLFPFIWRFWWIDTNFGIFSSVIYRLFVYYYFRDRTEGEQRMQKTYAHISLTTIDWTFSSRPAIHVKCGAII